MATSAHSRAGTLLPSLKRDRAAADGLLRLMAGGEIPTPRIEGDASESKRVTSLSVVVPARNEEQNIEDLLLELERALERVAHLRFLEVLVVDDGSTDRTFEIASERATRVIRHPFGLGNGAAVKRGIREARGEWILLLDGDGQHPPSAIPDLLRLGETHDLVVASRGGSGGSMHRNLANRVYNAFGSYVSGTRIPDLTSGFRLVRADVAKDLVWLLPNTFSYPTTITLSMLRGGYSVGFVPFQVRARRGKSHIHIWKDGSRFFLIILRIAIFYAPLRVFGPLSLLALALGFGWYGYTWCTEGRFTNMALLLVGQAMVLFALGLVSEQVATLRFQRLARTDER
ncbi:MAG: glycosyltransferase family 2 protein [Planctomycetota bacterium]